jgi:excisionase family DNA binding protein
MVQQCQPAVYRPARAAAKLGISRGTVYRFVKQGRLELIKLGERSSGITAESLNALLESGRAKEAGPV